MSVADYVLAQYPTAMQGSATPLGNHGGFSGASLFRVQAPAGDLCLRAWPADVTPERLTFIHALMQRARDQGLRFVPRIHRTASGELALHADGRCWELTDWMPGTACDRPDSARVQAACAALARIHLGWAEAQLRRAAPPAVERRLAVVREWLPLIAAGWQPRPGSTDPVGPWAQRAWTVVRRRLPELEPLLAAWRYRPLPLQPCLCDIWSAHMFFTEDRVTGVIDFGSCKMDHIAVDLARLLGSMAGDAADLWSAGLDAYADLRLLTADEQSLTHDLDRSGTVIAAANWLRWLYRECRPFADRAAAAARLVSLVARLT
jgi:Ser/Thr protein kinase RdoA (MazF antagonist)